MLSKQADHVPIDHVRGFSSRPPGRSLRAITRAGPGPTSYWAAGSRSPLSKSRVANLAKERCTVRGVAGKFHTSTFTAKTVGLRCQREAGTARCRGGVISEI